MRILIQGRCSAFDLLGLLTALADSHGLAAVEASVWSDAICLSVVGPEPETVEVAEPKIADSPGATVASQPEVRTGLTAPGGKAPEPAPGFARCRWCDAVKDVRGIGGHEKFAHPDQYVPRSRRAPAKTGPIRSEELAPIAPIAPIPAASPETSPTSPVASHAGDHLHSVDQDGPASGGDADRATIEPGPIGKYICACASAFDTAREWTRHRNTYPSIQQKHHRLIDQPKAAVVPTGIPAPVSDIQRARAAAYEDPEADNG